MKIATLINGHAFLEIMNRQHEETGFVTPHQHVPNGMALIGLFLARFSTAAWFGAAVLFVVVGVTEVTKGGFDSATKDKLVAVRFPAFYLFGFTLITLSWIGTWIARDVPELPKFRRLATMIALAVAMALMIVDYLTIYRALLDMVHPPGSTKPAHFIHLHEASKWINLAGLLFCLIAIGFLHAPIRRAANSK